MTRSPFPSAPSYENDEEAPIPYADEEQLEAAPIPYLESAIRALTLNRASSGGGDEEGGAEEGEEEGGDNEGEEGSEEEADDERDTGWREKIIGVDERIEIKPMTSQPYRWICHIRIRSRSKVYLGSGFLVNIPGSNTGCILTAGHNLWMTNRTYADSLEVTFPGRDPIIISEPTNSTNRQRYIVSPQYKQNFERLYDYGAIVLPGYQRKGFGYSAIVTDDEIRDSMAMVFGYPGDKGRQTMWGTGGKFLDPQPMQLRYTLDTNGGQSGSPVYIWHSGYWTVVGIHVFGSDGVNSATRLTVEKMREVLGWLKHPLQKVTLRAWDSDDKMVKIATRAQKNRPNGSGEVKARFSPDLYTDLMFVPLESTPQGIIISDDEVKYAIASVTFRDTYLRLNGRQPSRDMTVQPQGSGQVNCQYTVGSLEMVHIRRDADVEAMMNIESVKYPGVFLRMDARYVSSANLDGPPGSVNAQWTAGDTERFKEIRPDPDDSPEEPDDDGDVAADLKRQIEDLKKQVEDRDARIRNLGDVAATLTQVQADLARTKADLLALQNAPPKTITVQVPGPTKYVDVPGPTKYVDVPGPTKYVNVPGPTQYVDRVVYRDDPRWQKAHYEIAAYRSVAWNYHPLAEQVEQAVRNGTYLPNSDIYG